MASHKSRVKMATQTIQRVEKKVEKIRTQVDIDFGFNVNGTSVEVNSTHVEFTTTLPSCQKCDVKPARCNRKPWFAELDLSFLPFNVPKDDPDAEKVNEILNFSIEQQKEYDITDSSGMIAVILHRCFQALSISSSIVYGYRCTNKHAKFPQIWVEVKEYQVDNTWLELCKVRAEYLQSNYPECYVTEKYYDKPEPKMTSCCKDSRDMSDFLRKRRIEYYANFPDHALALSLNREQSYNFYFALVRYMFDKHKVSIQGIDPEIRFNCWKCGALPQGCRLFLSNILSDKSDEESDEEEVPAGGGNWKFKQCPRCMVASYCNKKCQDDDWKTLHSINCLSKGATYLLGDNPFMA